MTFMYSQSILSLKVAEHLTSLPIVSLWVEIAGFGVKVPINGAIFYPNQIGLGTLVKIIYNDP